VFTAPICSTSFLCFALQQSAFHHPTFFSYQRITLFSAYLYQKDERALPGNLHSNKFFVSSVKTMNVVSLTCSPFVCKSYKIMTILMVAISDKPKSYTQITRGSHLAAVNLTTVQVTEHSLMHQLSSICCIRLSGTVLTYIALTEIGTMSICKYSRTRL
jgi:hypothetical protein